MKIPELLAPAGTLDILKGAALAGADAVYFGGEMYGARAFAGNLSQTEVLEAISFLHSHEKKAYLTVNTLLKNREIEEGLFSYLRDFYEAGLDAVLIQDWGVLSFVRSHFPDLPVHASTQMCISSPYGYEFLKAHGVCRAVPARELSIEEIRTLCAVPGIETEVFVHGAMCVCFSGRCYLSGMIGGRSANRGRCGQPCRLPYTAFIDGKGASLPAGGKYPISMKDLCGLPALPALCEAGVASLKIEGRMKSKDYVTGVVAIYRKYLDRLAEETGKSSSENRADSDGRTGAFSVDPADMDVLRALGNRGNFAHTYYVKKNGPEMISFADSSFHADGAALAQARAAAPAAASPAESLLPVSLSFTARADEPVRLVIKTQEAGETLSVTVSGDAAEIAENKATTEAEIREKLLKLGGTGFTAAKADITIGENLFLPMSKVNALRREAAEALQKKLAGRTKEEQKTTPARRAALPPDPAEARALSKETEGNPATEHFFSIMDLSQLAGAKGMEKALSLIVPAFLLLKDGAAETLAAEKERGRKIYLSLPPVFRARLRPYEEELRAKAVCLGLSGYFVSQTDALQYLLAAGIAPEDIIRDPDLYTFNQETDAFYRSLGLVRYCLPYELNAGEIGHLPKEGAILPIYGRVPVMKTANCLLMNSGHCEENRLRAKDMHVLSYRDRKGAEVPVIRDCMNCINIMYNSVPTNLLSDLPEISGKGLQSFRMDFSTETADEAETVLSAFRRALFGEKVSFPGSFTRGHFRRGVE